MPNRFSPYCSNSPHDSGDPKVQWASSDPTNKPASFSPRTREISRIYRPLEDKDQPRRYPPLSSLGAWPPGLAVVPARFASLTHESAGANAMLPLESPAKTSDSAQPGREPACMTELVPSKPLGDPDIGNVL
ncbi:UNVERIFIED_CONTAM: hypothetical protein FKN15_042706 [Acipenser sinensis]